MNEDWHHINNALFYELGDEKTSTTNPLSHTFIPHTELSVPVLDLSF